MGADASIFLFDYSVYRDIVAPAITRFLPDGHVSEWLQDIRRQHNEYLEIGESVSPCLQRFERVDLRAHCDYLDAQFGVAAPATFRNLCESTWDIRACKSCTCPARARCPFSACSKTNPTIGDVEELLMLFQFAVARCCVGRGQFLGRSIDTFSYGSALDGLGVPSGDPIRILLERLGRRGFVVGYRWTTGTEGMHGWLDHAEADELSSRLFALDLPEYERSFAAMERFKSVQNLFEGKGFGLEFNALTYGQPGVPFDQLSLSFVRTVCFLASREGKGVLWGNNFA
jgi:hypothetical protein